MRSPWLAVVVLLAPWVLAAQDPTDAITPGMQIRFRADALAHGRITGQFAGLRGDTLVVAQERDTLLVPLVSARRLEANYRGGFRARRAWRGALKGAALGLLDLALASSDEEHIPAGGQLLLVGTSAAVGYLAAGAGSNGRRGALIGMLVGAPIGAVVGASTAESCSGGFLCFGPGFYATMGALAGAAIGGTVGLAAGAMTSGDHWERIKPDRLRLTIAPQARGGFALGATVAF